MEKLGVLLADSNFLIREGLKAVLHTNSDIEVIAEAGNSKELITNLLDVKPCVILIDYQSPLFAEKDVGTVKTIYPKGKVIGITDTAERNAITRVMNAGIEGHLMKDCDKEEIVDAIRATSKGNQFYCGKILNQLSEDESGSFTCEPVTLSPREIEIIQLIASGLTNKEIAEELCLSQHTVMTHRKKIMSKLGINNTAGLVIYAVKNNLISPNKFLFNS